MKKALLLICATMYAHLLFAQDTIDITHPSPCSPGVQYDYRLAAFDSIYCDNGRECIWPDFSFSSMWESLATKHYYPGQLPPIYGVGIPMWRNSYTAPPYYVGKMKLRPIIIQKVEDSLYPAVYGHEISSSQFGSLTADAYIKAPYYPECNPNNELWAYSKIFNLYFDSAITVTDTFFFGVATKKGWDREWSLSALMGACQSIPWQDDYSFFFYQIDSNDYSHVYAHDYYSTATGWKIPFILLFNPPDTDSFVCPEVEDFTYLGIQGRYPTFAWTGLDGVGQYEVRYGPYDADLDTLPTFTVDAPHFEIINRTLSPDTLYQACCRPVCHHYCPIHDTVLMGAWNIPQYFYVGESMPDTSHHDTSHVATPQVIEPPAFTLSPNPAHGHVALLLPEGSLPATAVLHDAAGHEVLRQRITSCQSTLSILTLPAGLYHVTLISASSSATQKLVIE